ncbi:uncharacterized protein LOC117594073 [Esox lucius]|uniref:uncharacterized protein LOC117594073 n=1 Tax=Esox lucius TaxID=8010 RepID=UPI0014769028|nr:uncharacterized protein LOC117594073 [Esox lucius]
MDSSYKDSFKDRIQWDQQTGQFTIRDLTTSDSGMYVVDGKGGVNTIYQLTVYEPVSRPMLTTVVNQSCSVECFVKNDRDVTLSWFSGKEILNHTSSPDLSIKLSLPLEVDKENRTSYRCEAANPVTKKNVTFHVPESCMVTKMTAICHTCLLSNPVLSIAGLLSGNNLKPLSSTHLVINPTPHPSSTPLVINPMPHPSSTPMVMNPTPHPSSTRLVINPTPHPSSTPLVINPTPHPSSTPLVINPTPHPSSTARLSSSLHTWFPFL